MNIKTYLLKNKFIIGAVIFVLLFILLNIGFLIWLNNHTQIQNQPVKIHQASVKQPAVKPKDFELRLGPQIAGRVLTVESLTAPQGGWIAIYQDNGGQPGNLIETAIPPFDPGIHTQEVFLLNNSLASGESYWLIIHQDNDKPAVNLKNEPVRQLFTVR